MTNQDTLEHLFASGGIALERSALLDTAPEPLSGSFSWERVEGMLLGLAIGDALGRPAEGHPPAVRRARYGEIRDYLPSRYAEGRSVGFPSDDTQLAFWTLEQLLADDGLDPAHLAERFTRDHIYGIGQTVLQFLTNLRRGWPWDEAGVASAGNGALMRIAPVLIPHLKQPTPALWADTALAAMITHNDRASTGSCVAFGALLWDLLGREETPEPEWWIDRFTSVLRPLEGETRYRSRLAPLAYEGPLWRFLETHVREALAADLSVVDACERWHSGAYLLETVPSVLYILARHGADPEEAIVRAVNDTKDNDTVAAIVGAAVGALHGREALPERWITALLGRTKENDDGRVFELIELARERWG
jgi:ADP-ribosylglycohydrolase